MIISVAAIFGGRNRMRCKFRLDKFGTRIGAIVVVAAQFFALPVAAAPTPIQGHFVSGFGSIRPVRDGIVIDQNSARAVIDWQGFLSGPGFIVRLENHHGVTFIRETGDSVLRIAGSLKATGSIHLSARRGVTIARKGSIMTAGTFVATAADLPSPDSTLRDIVCPPRAKGRITNAGRIVAVGGDVVLMGGDVTNSGSISAGTVSRGGKVLLISGGTTRIAGTLSARDASGGGGTIMATGNSVDVASSARLDASGLRGGTILIGGRSRRGTFAGDARVLQHVRPAATIIVERGAAISANGEHGKGGEVVVWSQKATNFAGSISARGPSREAAGYAEISSQGRVTLTGHVDLRAIRGGAGTLLLDPYNVTISKSKTVTENCTGGICTPEGNDSVLNVRMLESLLATGNVEVTTGSSGSQSGDITVAAPLSWSSAYTLTLDAYHSILVNTPITVKGAGGLSLVTNDGGSGGALTFAGGGHVRFSSLGSALTINGARFRLVGSIAALAHGIKADSTGNFALARSYDASRAGTYASSPIPTTLAGFVEGLGNAIVNLSINDGTTSDLVALFSSNLGTIENLNLENVAIVGPQGTTSSASIVGGLAGTNFGYLYNDSVSGSVSIGSAGGFANIGALAGASSGVINGSNSQAGVTAGVSSNTGGLVGLNNTYGSINNSFAGGNVTGGDSGEVGGLTGDNVGSISYSDATGAVTGGNNAGVGGLSGDNVQTGSILAGYATGSATGGANTAAGGLVGFNYAAISGSWAGGTVNGAASSNIGGLVGATDGSVSDSFATGNVDGTGDYVQAGGLAGTNFGSGTVAGSWSDGSVTAGDFASAGGLAGNNVGYSISNSYALGSISGGASADVGGLVGYSNSATSYAYSTGAPIGGTNAYVGGLLGYADVGSSATDTYWDTTTSGITNLSQGAGNIANDPGITGLTTQQFQSGLPVGFDPSVWAENTGINNGLPYLLANPPRQVAASRATAPWNQRESGRNCIDGPTGARAAVIFVRCKAANPPGPRQGQHSAR